MPPEIIAPSPKQIEAGTGQTLKMLTPGKVYKWD